MQGFFKITLNRELSTNLIQKNSLRLTGRKSQFNDMQKFHISPKQKHPISTEVLNNWPFVMWLQLITSSAQWFTFLSIERSTSWHEVMHLPIMGDFPPLPLCTAWRTRRLESWPSPLWETSNLSPSGFSGVRDEGEGGLLDTVLFLTCRNDFLEYFPTQI